jgi:hypothetical protein
LFFLWAERLRKKDRGGARPGEEKDGGLREPRHAGEEAEKEAEGAYRQNRRGDR